MENKAVIWCEDHGDLAYFEGPHGTVSEGADVTGGLDTGDLVAFEMEQVDDLRLARNMRRVEQGAYEGLGERIVAASPPQGTGKDSNLTPEKRARFRVANVIPFASRRAARRVGTLVLA
ncbi:MAG: hypothetical protein OQK05_03235 [Pseudopelagicola sp.]|nr:hypothetical protein [Pseudopelagicola sp.]